jgi:hypothetical protein
MHPKYLLLRLVRHFMPTSIAHFLLARGWIIRPGLETDQPEKAAQRYLDTLHEVGFPLSGKRVLIFGYGGNFAVGCGLLSQGADHVILCDKYAQPDQRRNYELVSLYPQFLTAEDDRIAPNPRYVTLIHDDIRLPGIQEQCGEVDIILSSSVYEHLDDVDGITLALTELTRSGGLHLHWIDLRDHYFRYPFEMLRFSENTWKRWLNPTSNLNRFRLPDYARVFNKYFDMVDITILDKDPIAFQQARKAIRGNFLSGDDSVDSTTIIRVMAVR